MRSPRTLVVSLFAIVALQASAQPPALVPPVSVERPDVKAPPLPMPTGEALTADDLDAWLDGYMPYALKIGDIAGAVVVVVKDGQVLTQRGYGYADVAKRIPVNPARTLFRPGSVSKLFTWTAVMQLVEQGKLDLDKDVNAYLDFKIPPRDGRPITLRNIMTHTTGFDETGKGIIFEDSSRLIPLGDYVKGALPKRIYAPGSTPSYSNYATALAGYIVERVSGQSFDAYVEQRIFAPLGMKSSTFRQPLPPRFRDAMATGYKVGSGEPAKFEFVGPAPAGSLSSSGADMGRFMIAHLQNGAFGGNRILRPETAETMHNNPLTMLPPLNRMELGFFETNINGREVIAHLGDTQVFHTSLHLFLKEGVGLYVSFNSAGKAGAVGGLRGALFTDFADRYFPGKRKDGRVDAKTAAEHARMMAGSWVLSRTPMSSFLNASELFGQVHAGVGPKGELSIPIALSLNGQPRKWVEIAPFVWRDANNHERLAAQVVDGRVMRFSIDGLSPFMVFDRAPWYKNSTWLKPLLYAGLAALALTVLLWPIAALVRRRYGAKLELDKRELRAFRLSRIGAAAIVAAVAGWAIALSGTIPSDPIIWLLQIAGSIAFIGGFALTLWNLWVVWTGKRRWPAKVWSVVLALSAFVILWIALAFKLISFGVNY